MKKLFNCVICVLSYDPVDESKSQFEYPNKPFCPACIRKIQKAGYTLTKILLE